ncbi:uncharacterized protein [Oscarella lobularis]|uniref:uncharacterized protein isoform X2 n=1 Tax=Oscarella lobularis TaxID=121494 RepID=UPI0033144B75
MAGLIKEEAGNASDELSRELIEKQLPSVRVEYEKREKNDDWVYDIFLSFSGKGSRVFCRQVCDRLESAGAKVFLDEEIEGGSHIVPVLLEALGQSKYVAVFLTHEMKGSSHPEAEATVALKVHGARDRLLPFFHTMSPEECQDADISVYLPGSDEKLYQMIAKIVGRNLQKEKEEDKVNAAAHYILKSMKFAVEETDTDGGRVKGLLQEEIQEKHLRAVYLKIQAFWKRVARELGLPQYEIKSCERSHSFDEERCYAMLQKWKTRQKGKGKVWDLASAIYKAELEGVVEEVYGESVLKALQSGN